jgi:protocatechuate 3,4-dioxygenase beta subunit
MADNDHQESSRLRRREALAGAGTLGLGGLIASARLGGVEAEAAAAVSCVLTPEVTERPYWIDNSLTRRDIRAGKPGLPLEIVFRVQNANTCKPIRNADVEIWHCDAEGIYPGYESLSEDAGTTPGEQPSGTPPAGGPPGGGGGGHQEPTDDSRYLRGHQKSDEHGKVRFLTVFPGWYRGRTPHIHLKVHVGGAVVHTGQVFFNQRITGRSTSASRTGPTAGPTPATPRTRSSPLPAAPRPC